MLKNSRKREKQKEYKDPLKERMDQINSVFEYHKEGSTVGAFKLKVQDFIARREVSITRNILQAFLALLCIVMYLWSTYDAYEFEDPNHWWANANFFIHLYFLFEYFLTVITSADYKKYLVSMDSIVDITSTVPFLIVKISLGNPLSHIFNHPAYIFVEYLDLLRITKLQGIFQHQDNDINRQLASIIITVTSLVLITSGFVQLVENLYIDGWESPTHDFHSMFYFIMTTVSTVGYGDIAIVSWYGQQSIIALVIFSLYIIPSKSSELVQLLSSKSIYARKGYKKVEDIQHILITGTITNTAAEDYFSELFDSDHGELDKHAVVLQNNRPSREMENLMRTPELSSYIFYLQGDCLLEKDLKRCQIESTRCITILCHKQTQDPNSEDAKTILQAMVIKKYLKACGNSNAKLCMQLIKPESKMHYYLTLSKQTRNDQVICIEEIKLSLLAKSCLCPGLVALIANLISSSGEPPENLNIQWLEEYWSGRQFEIYKTIFSPRFKGITFSQAAQKIYREFNAILFAMEIGQGDGTNVLLNPGQYKISANKDTIVSGYIIAEDKAVAEEISKFEVINTEADLGKGAMRGLTRIEDLGKLNLNTRTADQSPLLNPQVAFTAEESNSESNSSEEEDDFTPNGSPTKEKAKFDNDKTTLSIGLSEQTDIENRCHCSPIRNKLEDITYETMLNSPLCDNHVLVCGLVTNLFNFVMPLRAKYLETIYPILILHPEKPTEKQWSQISFFPEIYYLRGSALNKEDLIRANISKAARVVVLAPGVNELKYLKLSSRDQVMNAASKNKLELDEENLLDANTIFRYKITSKIRPDIKIVTELVAPQNLSFLLPRSKDHIILKQYGYEQTPTYAAGFVYLSSIMDALVCQAYYNPALLTVMSSLIGGNVSQDDQIKQSNLYQIPVPEFFIGLPFERLFDYLTLKQNIVPLGLYRLPGCTDNKTPYVVTNPAPQCKITDKDNIFILAAKKPGSEVKSWGRQDEKKYSTRTWANLAEMRETNPTTERYLANKTELEKLNDESFVRKMVLDMLVSRITSLKQKLHEVKSRLIHREANILGIIRKAIQQEIARPVGMLKGGNQDEESSFSSDEQSQSSENQHLKNNFEK